MTTTVYAVRATMVSGTSIDLLLFAAEHDAIEYLRDFTARLPLGFDRVEVVGLAVIGTIAKRRAA